MERGAAAGAGRRRNARAVMRGRARRHFFAAGGRHRRACWRGASAAQPACGGKPDPWRIDAARCDLPEGLPAAPSSYADIGALQAQLSEGHRAPGLLVLACMARLAPATEDTVS